MGLFRHSVERLDKGMDPKPEAVKTLVERKFHEPRPAGSLWGRRTQEFDHRSTHNYRGIRIHRLVKV